MRLIDIPECPTMRRQGERIMKWCWEHNAALITAIKARNRRKQNHLNVCPICQRHLPKG